MQKNYYYTNKKILININKLMYELCMLNRFFFSIFSRGLLI